MRQFVLRPMGDSLTLVMSHKATEYWCRHLRSGTLLKAIEADERAAQAFFGLPATVRKSLPELIVIIAAREVLSGTAQNQVAELLDLVNSTMTDSLNSVPPPVRARFIEIVVKSPEHFRLRALELISAIEKGQDHIF